MHIAICTVCNIRMCLHYTVHYTVKRHYTVKIDGSLCMHMLIHQMHILTYVTFLKASHLHAKPIVFAVTHCIA